MVTDDERRRVAERLRASIPGDGVMRRGDKGWSLLYRTIFGHYIHNQSAGRTYSEVAGRVADLIEPSCDRDALMALSDEINDTSCDNRGELSVSLGDIWGWSQAIREALGVEDA